MTPRLTIVVSFVDRIGDKMAEMRRRNGKWVVTIRFPNNSPTTPKSQSKTFDSKLEALVWPERFERELKLGKSQYHLTRETFADLARVYLKEVTPIKKGGYNERYIISRLLTDSWANMPLGKLTTGHLS